VVNLQIIILIVVVSLFFGANSAFASEIYRPYLSWDNDAYKLAETGTITLHINEANKSPFLIDLAYVHLSSDSDKIGSDILVVETFVNTGYFSGNVKFRTDTDGASSLKTNVGDLVYIEFDYLSDSAKILSSLDDESSTVKHIVVTTDKASYSKGEIIRITGEVRDLDPNATLTLNVAGFLHEVAIDADKKFILTLTAGEERKQAGKYSITATYINPTGFSGFASTPFEVYRTLPSDPYLDFQSKSTNRDVQVWMIPVVVAGIGIGVFVIKRRKFLDL